jgi:hypothetical protein
MSLIWNGDRKMSVVEPTELAELLGVRKPKGKKLTSMDLADMVVRGFPVEAVERLCLLIAPEDISLRHGSFRKRPLHGGSARREDASRPRRASV